MLEEKHRVLAFEDFRLDTLKRQLLRENELLPLNAKAFDLLLALVENSGRVMTKDELLETVWNGQFVEENNLTVNMTAIRKALGERANNPRYIVTISGQGYRFVGDVHEVENGNDGLIFESQTITRIVVEEEQSEEPGISSSPIALPSGRNKTRVALFVASTVLLIVFGAFILSRFISPKEKTPQFERAEIKRLTSTGGALGAAVSPSGEYVVYIQREASGQSLWLKHLPTESSTQIVEPKTIEYWGLKFTPDNHYIYATTFEKNQADPILNKIPVLGETIEKLSTVTNAAVSFSPDGKRMAYVVSSSSSGGSILWTANPKGEDKKFVAIRKNPNYFLLEGSSIDWSPDGETIACAVVNNDANGIYMTLVSYGASDGKEKTLTSQRWNVVSSVVWARDGSGLFLTGNEKAGLPMQVWFVSATDGAANKITNDLNNYSGVSLTANGNSLAVVQTDTISSIWTSAANENLKADFQQAHSEVGMIPSIGWTPEGKLVYQSSASGSQELWSLDVENKKASQLSFGAHLNNDFDISPDGSFIVFVSNRAGKPNLWRANADGTNHKQLTNGNGEVAPHFTPDGKFVIYQSGFGSVNSSVWKVSIEGGTPQQITKSHNIAPDISPDGKMIAYSYMDTSKSAAGKWCIGIASSEDGKQTQTFAFPSSVVERFMRWTPDGKGLVYISTVGNISNLWLQTLNESEPGQITNFASHSINSFDWSHDGKRLAIARYTETRDVILLEKPD